MLILICNLWQILNLQWILSFKPFNLILESHSLIPIADDLLTNSLSLDSLSPLLLNLALSFLDALDVLRIDFLETFILSLNFNAFQSRCVFLKLQRIQFGLALLLKYYELLFKLLVRLLKNRVFFLLFPQFWAHRLHYRRALFLPFLDQSFGF